MARPLGSKDKKKRKRRVIGARAAAIAGSAVLGAGLSAGNLAYKAEKHIAGQKQKINRNVERFEGQLKNSKSPKEAAINKKRLDLSKNSLNKFKQARKRQYKELMPLFRKKAVMGALKGAAVGSVTLGGLHILKNRKKRKNK